VGMMECKNALTEADGDFDKAIELLREKLKGKMDERSDRAAAEGAIAVAVTEDSKSVAMIELNTETDFTARNDEFVESADKIAAIALEMADGEITANDAIKEMIDNIRITTKENASFARGVKFTAPEGGKAGAYLHHNRKVSGLVVVDGEVDDELLTGLGQHISAMDGMMLPVPLAIDKDSLPQADLEAKQNEFVEEAKSTGKPAEIAEKIATGKMGKWVDENTLLGQPYVKDMTGKTKVGEALPKGVTITHFVRYAVGMAQS